MDIETDLRHDPAIVAQEVERAQALNVQVDVDAAVLVQEEQAHCVGALQAQASTSPMEDAGSLHTVSVICVLERLSGRTLLAQHPITG